MRQRERQQRLEEKEKKAKEPAPLGSKFGDWVTEFGPALCGTFGCTLPNNHSGLHRLPPGATDGPRGRRGKREEPVCQPVSNGPPARKPKKACSRKDRYKPQNESLRRIRWHTHRLSISLPVRV